MSEQEYINALIILYSCLTIITICACIMISIINKWFKHYYCSVCNKLMDDLAKRFDK